MLIDINGVFFTCKLCEKYLPSDVILSWLNIEGQFLLDI
ncbi:hypothetical protein HMPREF1521_1146 [Veillonella sp. AS16]|nr:hypothetical protein HMPREF1521_1146 [Veillonella sp. AS16]